MVSKRLSHEAGHRRKFLAIIDETPECERAVAYAAYRVKATGGGLVLLFVVDAGDFKQWLGVEQIMREEAVAAANAALDKAATKVREKLGIEPELVVREGAPTEEITKLIEEDQDIGVLVLGASKDPSGPGPLVGVLAGGRTVGTFPVPITVVPGHLAIDEILALS
jgi:nucleotide-binding universal stress UspA family protein